MPESARTKHRVTLSFVVDLTEADMKSWVEYYDLTRADPQAVGERIAEDITDNVLGDQATTTHVTVWPDFAVQISQ